MKKALLVLLAFIMMMPLAMKAQYLTEGFESTSSGLPAGWVQVSGTVAAGTSYPCSGSRSLKFSNSLSNLVALPVLSVEISMVELTINTRPEDTYANSGNFQIGYMTDVTNASSFVPVQTVRYSDFHGACGEITATFTDAPTGSRIAFRHLPVYDNYYWFVDDVNVHDLPTCIKPSGVTVSNITSDAADLSWTANNSEAEWEIVINGNVESATSNPYTLSNLTPQTSYNGTIRAICTVSDTSLAANFSFTTPCAPVAITDLPYTETFESYPTGSSPSSSPINPCWYRYTSTYSVYPYVYASAAHNGSKGFYFNGSSSYYAALPQFEENLTSLQFSFYQKASSSSYVGKNFYVGIMSNPTDLSTFDTVYTGTIASDWTLVEVPFSNYLGTGRHIAIRTPSYMYTDDYVVDYLPSCVTPSNLVATGISHNSITLSWTENGTATAWNLTCMSATDTTTTQVSSNQDYVISNLTPETTYTFSVNADCGSETSNSISSSFTTLCTPEVAPYSEDFTTFSTTVSNCWKRYSGLASATTTQTSSLSSTTSGWAFSNSNVFGAGHGKVNVFGTNKYWLVSPVIDLSNLANPSMTFDLALTDYNNENPIEDPNDVPDDKFIVFISTDNGMSWDMTNATVWDSSSTHPFNQISTTGQEVLIDLAQYAGQNIVVAFYAESSVSNGDNDLHIDNLVIDETPTCFKPSDLAIGALTENSATISWTEIGTASSWNIEYGPTGFAVGTGAGTVVSATSTSEVLSNLTNNTTYDVYVQSNCGSDVSAWTNTVTFTTLPAAPATLPYSCDFEDATEAGNWFFANGTYTNQWVIDTADNNTPGGTTAMYVSNDNGATNAYTYNSASDVWAYRDIYFAPAAEYTLSFDWKANGESSYDYLKVYIGNPAVPSGSTAPAGATAIFPLLNQQTTWQTAQYTFNSSYSGTTKRIYFYWKNDVSVGHDAPAAVDNIQITSSNCGTPSGLVASNISATGAHINWNAAFDTDSQWEVVYDTAGFDPNQAIATPVYDTAMTLDNLTAETDYEVYVRTDCGSGEYSNWSLVCSFTTLCAAEMAPYIEDFTSFQTGFSPCWKRYSGLASATTTQTSSLSSTTSGWIFSNSNVFGAGHGKVNVYGTSCKYWLVSPVIDLSNITTPTMTFDLALTDYGNEDPIENPNNVSDDKFIVFISTDNGMSWNRSNATVWDNAASSTHRFNQISTTGEEVTIDLSQYAGQNIVVAFYAESTIDNGDNDLHIDNLYIGEPITCRKPSALIVTETTSSSISIAWTGNGTASAWNVEYGVANFTPGTGAGTVVNVTDTFVTISNLTGNTDYQFFVQSDCGGETSLWSQSIIVSTLCDAQPIPFTDNFDSYQTYETPNCWTSLSTYISSSYEYPYVSSTYKVSAPNSLYFYNGSSSTYCMIASPEFDNTVDLNTLELTFNYYSSSSSAMMEVGVMSNLADVSTFVAMDTIYGPVGTSSNWVEQTINLSSYTGTGHFIAFKLSGSYYSAYIDDVDLHLIPTCPKPTNFVATSSDQSSVTLSWTEVGSATTWNIEYGQTGFTPGAGTTVSATTNPFTVTGLPSSTVYDFYVQAACSTDDASILVGPVTYATLCDAFNMPFVEDFNSISSGIPTCWNNDEGTTTTDSYKWNYYDSGYEGSGVRFNSYSNSNGNTNTLKTPIINIVSGATLSFYYKNPTGGDFSIYVEANGTQTLLEGGLTGMSDWTRKSYDLSTYANQAIQIAFMGTSNWGIGDAYIYLDSVAIVSASTPPTPCAAPTNLTATGATSNSVVLSWTENGNATSWTVNYKEDGVSTWSTATANTTTYTLTGLNASTPYSAYVIANCADGSSDPSNTVTFTTLSEGSGIEAYELSTTLYPNPNNGQFTIRNAQFTMNSVSVYDVYGKLLMTVEVNGNEATIDATAFANGMYFARIATEKGVVTKSFVKK